MYDLDDVTVYKIKLVNWMRLINNLYKFGFRMCFMLTITTSRISNTLSELWCSN